MKLFSKLLSSLNITWIEVVILLTIIILFTLLCFFYDLLLGWSSKHFNKNKIINIRRSDNKTKDLKTSLC